MGFIDAQVHVWTDDTIHYPLARGCKVEDMKPKRFTPEDLFRHTRRRGSHQPHPDSKKTSRRALAYIRFSTFQQLDGGSLLRPTGLTDAHCQRKGVALDDSLCLQDLGVSVFRGAVVAVACGSVVRANSALTPVMVLRAATYSPVRYSAK